jgi:hypothetical protein
MGSGEVLTTASELRSELQSEDTDETMMTGGARPKRGRWRPAKSRRKLEKAAKNSGQKKVPPEEAMQRDQPDTLLLSALKYWEVERDLIEERLANIRSATAAS